MVREDALIERMQQGDIGAADALIAQYYPEILRYCRLHAPRSLAEDAAQTTFLKLIRYFDRYAHRGKFRPFLYRIAAHTCIDMRRKYAELPWEEGLEPACADAALEEVQEEIALRERVRCLPAEQRGIILLRFGQDMTLREIAEALDLPLRTVQSRLRAALKRLKKEFQEGGAIETRRV